MDRGVWGVYIPQGQKESDSVEATQHTHTGEGNGTPLQYSCLENPMDGGAWQAAVHGVAKSQTQLRDLTFSFHFHALEKEMATHSSVLAWRIPGTAEPGGLPSMGSHRVRHDLSDLAAIFLQKLKKKTHINGWENGLIHVLCAINLYVLLVPCQPA